MSIARIDITLEEPFCCSEKPLEGNETRSLPYIPCTTLRGAVFWKLTMEGHHSLVEQLLGPEGAKWYPAWPQEKDRIFVPTPFCYVVDKTGKYPGVRNRFLFEDEHRKHSWNRISQAFCEINSMGEVQRPHRVAEDVEMHNALDYRRQATRGEELYARGGLRAGAAFTAWFDTGDRKIPSEELSGEVLLGKRRSAGSGKSTWSVTQVKEIDWQSCAEDEEQSKPEDPVRIQLMTHAVVPGRRGGYHCGFSEELLREALGKEDLLHEALGKDCDVEIVHCWSERKTVFGWSDAWGLPREQAPAIAAGSVCEFRFKNQLSKEKRKLALGKLRDGIGIRRVEGFGIVAVRPSWLNSENIVELQMEAARLPEPQPPLPGDPALMRQVLRNMTVWPKSEHGKAKKLIAHSFRLQLKELEAWVSKAKQKNKGWEKAGDLFSKARPELLGKEASPEQIRYWLAAAALLGRVKEDSARPIKLATPPDEAAAALPGHLKEDQ